MNSRYSQYDDFAWFYNRYWTVGIPDLLYQALEKIFIPYLHEGDAVLDVCCGTGQLAAELLKHAVSVTGIDGSEKMLEFARKNAPKAEFLAQDARYFTLEKQFDAAFSVFDSLNHIPSEDDLLLVFQRVRAALKPGGLFVFDLNSYECLETCMENGFSIVHDDNICVVRPNFMPENLTCVYAITTFKQQKDAWIRNDVEVIEWYYSLETVFDLLGKAGFSEFQAVTAEDDLGIESLGGRIFVSAR